MININEKKNCCGCTACYSACPEKCIEMKEDAEGFSYPEVDLDKCIKCGLCEKVCPIINCEPDTKKEQWAYLVRASDEKVRGESTSGGAFTLIAESIIRDGGIVYGAAFDSEFRVCHQKVTTIQELRKFRNSKYVQSSVGNTFKEIRSYLKSGQKVLFSGTPCQAEGLYRFLQGNTDNLLLVDVVCHAVPSPMFWEKYKEFRKPQKESELIDASFRDKSKYGYQYSQMKMEYADGTQIYCGVESDPYLRAFFSDLSDRPSCYECAFKKRYRVSDITLWDCFTIHDLDKSLDDNKGVTRALVHSPKGKQAITKIQNAVVKEIDPEVAVNKVRELVKSVNMNESRAAFFEDCETLETNQLMQKWFPDTVKVKAERCMRKVCEKLGIYAAAKRAVKKLIKR